MAVLSGARLSSEAAKTRVNPALISSWLLCPRPPLLGYWQSDEEGSRFEKGSAEKWSAGISISLGWPVMTRSKKRTTWVTMCSLFDQFRSNFRYFMDFRGTRTLVMVTEHEGLSALVIFLGIFSRNGRFSWRVRQRTTYTRLNAQTVERSSVWCCWGTVLDLQAWKVTRSKDSASLYRTVNEDRQWF